jgi:basic membrane lipoprotein Med (substrate-binding protein (PBP1-ABC) superfamily)
MYKNLAGRALVAWLTACFLLSAPLPGPLPTQPAPPLKIGFVYVTPLTEAGWVRQHDEGRQAVEAALGARVKTTYVENVAEGADAERVIRDLAQQGHRLIFTPSFGYMEPTLKVARDFPEVKFESITGYKTAPNVATANARYYEGRYLAGVAAGRMTKSNVAGYVAGFPIPEVLQGINAFTLGMRSVNPKATVRVVWLKRVVRSAEGARRGHDPVQPVGGRDRLPHRIDRGDGGGAGARQAGDRLPLRHAPGSRPTPRWSRSRTSAAATTRSAPARCSTAAGRAPTSGAA